jgi:DNA-binding response OmpR family regulator
MSARLLLIEDDASIARFVDLALEELAVDLTTVGTLAEARQQLAEQRFDAVITDLMLPDGSSIELMEAGHAREGTPWIAFSAGLTPERLASLHDLGVQQTLRKPVSLAALMDAVSHALQATGAGAAPAATATPTPAPPPAEPLRWLSTLVAMLPCSTPSWLAASRASPTTSSAAMPPSPATTWPRCATSATGSKPCSA